VGALPLHFGTEKSIRYLYENAGSVTGERIGPDGTAMRQVAQDLQPLLHYGVAFFTLDVRDETNATRVVLVCGVVETLRPRQT
jgi:hypothetical protein